MMYVCIDQAGTLVVGKFCLSGLPPQGTAFFFLLFIALPVMGWSVGWSTSMLRRFRRRDVLERGRRPPHELHPRPPPVAVAVKLGEHVLGQLWHWAGHSVDAGYQGLEVACVVVGRHGAPGASSTTTTARVSTHPATAIATATACYRRLRRGAVWEQLRCDSIVQQPAPRGHKAAGTTTNNNNNQPTNQPATQPASQPTTQPINAAVIDRLLRTATHTQHGHRGNDFVGSD